ncbi:hypothetical protein [Chamaesiphon sp.]|uniref:hypothetical protein n=1 Tax=Chamaesiphon sp. TaxID=2814140 RepID=UPI003593E86A
MSSKKQPSDQSPETPLSFYANAVDDKKKLLTHLDELVKSRTLSTDDRGFYALAMAETVTKATEHLHGVSTEIPNVLKLMWDEEKAQREAEMKEIKKEQQKLLSIAKKSGGKAGNASTKLLSGSIGCTGGIIIAMILSSFILFPRQLSASRGADGAILEWLSTPDGALLRRSFASGNKSVAECVSKASKSNPKAPGDKKISCLLEIK